MTPTHMDLVCRLHELIAALDRRVPGAGESEAWIARETAALRNRAVERITELESECLASSRS